MTDKQDVHDGPDRKFGYPSPGTGVAKLSVRRLGDRNVIIFATWTTLLISYARVTDMHAKTMARERFS